MNDVGIIIAIVGSGVGIIAVILSMFFWIRTEANADRRQQSQDTKELRQELIGVMRSIDEEFKDYHGRLIRLEEARLSK